MREGGVEEEGQSGMEEGKVSGEEMIGEGEGEGPLHLILEPAPPS